MPSEQLPPWPSSRALSAEGDTLLPRKVPLPPHIRELLEQAEAKLVKARELLDSARFSLRNTYGVGRYDIAKKIDKLIGDM